MLGKLRLRLTLYISAVIGCMLLLIALAVFWNSPEGYRLWVSNPQAATTFIHRTVITSGIILLIVFFGSLFITDRAMVPVKKAWQKQIDFTADASHELRTPLAVIQTNLELVMGNPEETVESQKKWLDSILSESKRMAKLVEGLLILSRADSGQQMLMMSHFMLDLTLKDVLCSYEAVAKAKGVVMTSGLASSVKFYGDSDRIKQLVVILLDNAVKYTDTNGRITVQLIRKDKHVVLSVSDTGVGIAQEDLNRIFDRFYRAAHTKSGNQGGAGLGLAIAYWIVREHRGIIRVESSLGGGTTFSVMLPIELRKNRCR